MLRLIESGARPTRRTAWTLASSLVHGSFIAMAVVLTTRAPMPAAVPPREVRIYLTTPHPRADAGRRDVTPGIPGGVGVPRLPLSIPLTVAPGARFDLPERFRVGGSELPGTGIAVPGVVQGGGLPTGTVHEHSQVDRAVVPRGDNPRPDYPAGLRSASVEGDVVVQFVVDTTGLVERGSVMVLEATHESFADAVRRWLPRTRYVAAEARGKRVRQLVQQRVAFTLAR
jgi:protein TonB